MLDMTPTDMGPRVWTVRWPKGKVSGGGLGQHQL
jgi:hypothetical protein